MIKIEKDTFDMIEHWSSVFGLPILKTPQFPTKDRIELAIKLIEEELQELKDAIADNNLNEVKDATGDLLWVTTRCMMEFGINPQSTIKAIYKSNMSKTDISIGDALITAEEYYKKGISTSLTKKDGLYITKRVSDGKILKSHKFQEPNFDENEPESE